MIKVASNSQNLCRLLAEQFRDVVAALDRASDKRLRVGSVKFDIGDRRMVAFALVVNLYVACRYVVRVYLAAENACVRRLIDDLEDRFRFAVRRKLKGFILIVRLEEEFCHTVVRLHFLVFVYHEPRFRLGHLVAECLGVKLRNGL